MQGWRKRMEDSHISDLNLGNNGTIHAFGVFDGHGGKEVAQFVKTHFSKELVTNKSFQAGNLKNALQETFFRMDTMLTETENKAELKRLAKKSKEEDEKNGQNNQNKQMELFKQMFDRRSQEDCDIALMTGCTASVCVIDEENKKIWFANAGDSRAVICKNGIAYPMSIDHKPDLEIEKNRIYKADGFVSEGRVKGNLNLSRSLGDMEYKQNSKLNPEDQMITANPDIVCESLTSDVDFIIIACDGVWDCLTNQEVCDIVSDKFKKDPNIRISKIIEDIFDQIVAPDIKGGKYMLI
jgi:protein phosphatase 1G